MQSSLKDQPKSEAVSDHDPKAVGLINRYHHPTGIRQRTAGKRVPREAHLVFSKNVQCAILDVQLNIQHYPLSIAVTAA
jgi:hypothetical protein